MHQIVIVGGGAGGLELATRLGDKLGNDKYRSIEPAPGRFVEAHADLAGAGIDSISLGD